MNTDQADRPRPQVQAAREALAEAQQARRFPITNYTQVVRQLPMLLQRHGLGQTLAYLQLRAGGSPTSAFDLVGRQLDRWLLHVTAVPGRGALAALSARDSRYYREASAQAWLFVRALCACVEEVR